MCTLIVCYFNWRTPPPNPLRDTQPPAKQIRTKMRNLRYFMFVFWFLFCFVLWEISPNELNRQNKFICHYIVTPANITSLITSLYYIGKILLFLEFVRGVVKQ